MKSPTWATASAAAGVRTVVEVLSTTKDYNAAKSGPWKLASKHRSATLDMCVTDFPVRPHSRLTSLSPLMEVLIGLVEELQRKMTSQAITQ
jgi:hypothetical protein